METILFVVWTVLVFIAGHHGGTWTIRKFQAAGAWIKGLFSHGP